MVPDLAEIWRRGIALALASLVVAACSSSGRPGKQSKTITNAQMCQDLSTIHNLFAQVGFDESVSATRSDFANLTARTARYQAEGPPAGVSKAFDALVVDLKAVNQWVQTQATQADFAGNKQPASVKKSYEDIGTQYNKIDAWSAKNCK